MLRATRKRNVRRRLPKECGHGHSAAKAAGNASLRSLYFGRKAPWVFVICAKPRSEPVGIGKPKVVGHNSECVPVSF